MQGGMAKEEMAKKHAFQANSLLDVGPDWSKAMNICTMLLTVPKLEKKFMDGTWQANTCKTYVGSFKVLRILGP